jgi:hypothetical protein
LRIKKKEHQGLYIYFENKNYLKKHVKKHEGETQKSIKMMPKLGQPILVMRIRPRAK